MMYTAQHCLFAQWNLQNNTAEVLPKGLYLAIWMAQSLYKHVYIPRIERPPVLRDPIVYWLLWVGLIVTENNE